MKPKIYLAHSFDLMIEAKTDIEPLLAEHFEVINPFEGRFDRLKEYVGKGKFHFHGRGDPKVIVESDVNDILRSDGVFVYNIDGCTTGSTMEIVYGYTNNKPVVAVVPRRKMKHPWLQYHCICVTISVQKAMRELKKYFDKDKYNPIHRDVL